MFSSPLQPLDETSATLVPADCPRPWATTYPACQRCVVTRGARISHPFWCRTTATTFPPASRSKFAAVAQVSTTPNQSASRWVVLSWSALTVDWLCQLVEQRLGFLQDRRV